MWIGYRLLDRKITYPDVPFLSRRQRLIQNTRGLAGERKDRTCRAWLHRIARNSTVEHSTTPRNVAIPTITIQSLKQSWGNYVRNWWALGNTSETAAVLQRRLLTTLSTTAHHTKLRHTHSAVENPQRRRRCTNSAAQSAHRTPPHKLSSADPEASTPTTCSTRTRLAPLIVLDADMPRGRPGGRPLGISHQHSASSPR